MNRHLTACILVLISLFSEFATGQENPRRWLDFLDSVEPKLKSKRLLVQVAAIEEFENEDYDRAAEYLLKIVEAGRADPAILRKASKVLGSYKDERAAQMVDNTVLRKPEGSYFLLQAYLGKNTTEGPKIAFQVLENAKTPPVQRAAIEGVANNPHLDSVATEKLLKYLNEETYHSVRKAAVYALGRIATKDQVEPLIAILNDKVVGSVARDSLLRLTGERHWRDSNAWKSWWEDNKATFSPEPMDDATFQPIQEKLLEEKGDNAMMVEFYEREITGKNMLFLLDRSGSMMEMALDSGISRMEKLKSQLDDVLNRLDEEYSVGLVMFPMDTFPRRGIEKMTVKFRDKAQEYVKELKPTGATPLGEAIEHAYKKIVPKYNVDTIYLLSDGDPSDITNDDLLQEMMTYGDKYGVTVNCISIGQESELLKEIAKTSGGQYWEVQ